MTGNGLVVLTPADSQRAGAYNMGAMCYQLFTIGHSTHSFDELVSLLKQHGIEMLVDIRRFPGSRRWPQFNRDHLAGGLAEVGIEYRWMEALGGRRGKQSADSENLGLRHPSFRNYADYMETAAFRTAVRELLEIACAKRTAIMCSEGLYWRCHRRLVADFLLTRDIVAQHIMPDGKLRAHVLTDPGKIRDGRVSYPLAEEDRPLLTDLRGD